MVLIVANRHGNRLEPTQALREKIRRMAETVHPLFVHHHWTYGFRTDEVPTVEQLERTILRLLDVVVRDDRPGADCSSGRFNVYRRISGDIEICLDLDGP